MIAADCWKCAWEQSEKLRAEGKLAESLSFIMYVCPECGNKRCPKASDHAFDCSGSNDPGQYGSVYTKYNKFDPDEVTAGLEKLMGLFQRKSGQ